MHPHPHNPLSDVIMLPVLLIVALAAWAATFLGSNPARR